MLKWQKIMSQKLNLSIKNSLNMTSSLRQSIEILQMPSIDLAEFVSSEIEKNPLLQPDDYEVSSKENVRELDHNTAYKNDENYDPISRIRDEKTTVEYIFEQVGQIIKNPKDRIIAAYLVNLLDDKGYIKLDIETASKNLKCNSKKISKILLKLHDIEPAGIFARNLEECLIIQLKAQDKYDNIFQKIMENLHLLAKHDLIKLAKICKITLEEMRERLTVIKSLNPRPLSSNKSHIVATRIPDVYLDIDENDKISVSLNPNSFPKILVNKELYENTKKQKLSEHDKEFISNNYYAANNLLRSISQRSKTILDVAEAIAAKQKNFFLKGVMYFEPLTLSDIAKEVSMNESTISRATNGKFISTPTGIYEMKFFFSSNLSAKNSTSFISSTKAKEILKTIIEEESPENILSDDIIALELSKFNINIARRTVAKYREALGIDTSSVRKRKAKMLNQ